jgi:hypothetical protein
LFGADGRAAVREYSRACGYVPDVGLEPLTTDEPAGSRKKRRERPSK